MLLGTRPYNLVIRGYAEKDPHMLHLFMRCHEWVPFAARVKVSRASVTPFELCGASFVHDLMTSATQDQFFVSQTWRNRTTDHVAKNRRLINLAYDKGVLIRDDQFPVGQRWDELALLRFASTNSEAELYVALTSKLNGKASRKLLSKLSWIIWARWRSFFYLY